MARPIRGEFGRAVYHVTARGNEPRDIYRDVPDRQRFLETLAEAVGAVRRGNPRLLPDAEPLPPAVPDALSDAAG
jgi:hypothetical protein